MPYLLSMNHIKNNLDKFLDVTELANLTLQMLKCHIFCIFKIKLKNVHTFIYYIYVINSELEQEFRNTLIFTSSSRASGTSMLMSIIHFV